MTVEQLQARMRGLHARIGFDGRFCLSIDADPHGGCYVTHWFRPTRYGPERWCKVGGESVAACLSALERYAATYQAQQGSAFAAADAYDIAAE